VTHPLNVAGWVPWLRDRSSSVSPGSEPKTVTFPTSPLNAKVLLALGADLTKPPSTWSWVDITNYVRFREGITVTTGRQDEDSTVNTMSAALTLDNRDGRFSRRNPNGPYYGQLSLNTPIWATIDAGSGEHTRLAGYVTEWPTRWDRSGHDSTAVIQCAGILRRLSQGTVAKSPLRRTMAGSGAALYWPFEDGTGSTRFASGLLGGTALTPKNLTEVFPGTFSVGPGSLSVASFVPLTQPPWADNNYGGYFATIDLTQAGIGSTKFTVGCVFAGAPAASAHPMYWDLFQLWTDQRKVYVSVYQDVASGVPSPTNHGVVSTAGTFQGLNTFDGLPHSVLLTCEQVGADLLLTFTYDGVTQTPVTASSLTLGTPQRLFIAVPIFAGALFGGLELTDNTGSTLGLGHLAIWGNTQPTDPLQAAIAYKGEAAHTRIIRNCAEEGIPLTCVAGRSSAMGPQPIDGIVEVLRDAETVDGGVLYEPVDNWGLGFQSIDERYNQPVSLGLDFNQGQVAVEPEPADDDQRIRNRWTVNRDGGSEATLEARTGPMGTQPGGPGVYDDSVTANVYLDDQLDDQAGWRLHLGQLDVDRWTSVALRFHHDPSLIEQWCAMPFGARVSIANPPSQVAPDALDLVVEGWAERWDPLTWGAVMNTSPAQAYTVARLDDDVLGKLDTSGCELVSAVSSGATTFAVYTTTSPSLFPPIVLPAGLAEVVWTTDPAEVPWDARIAGERVTFTAVSSYLRDTFAVPSASGWPNADTGQALALAGGVATDYTVAGGAGIISISAVNSSRTVSTSDDIFDCSALVPFTPAVLATGSYIAAAFQVRRQASNGNHYRFELRFNVDGSVTAVIARLGAGSGDLATATPSGSYGAGSKWWLRAQAVGTALRMRAWPDGRVEPSIWQASTTDDRFTDGGVGVRAILNTGNTNTLPVAVSVGTIDLYNPQTVTVTRAVNGIVKAHNAGEALSLWNPVVLAL
jgi:hypothetical protein